MISVLITSIPSHTGQIILHHLPKSLIITPLFARLYHTGILLNQKTLPFFPSRGA